MTDKPELESLYREAKSALKAREYDRATALLTQILVIDENYRDASRLLAQTVKLKRCKWYNHPALWGTLGVIAVVGLFVWLIPKLSLDKVFAPSVPTVSPTTMLISTMTAIPSKTPTLTPTPIPLAWKRISIGQEFTRDSITAIVVDPKDPDVIYVGTENAGVYKSIDGGVSWQPAQNGLVGGRIDVLAIDPNDPQVLYAAIHQGGIFRTVDGGQSWNKLSAYGHPIFSLAVAPWDSQVLFQWGRHGSLRSDDGGATFHPIADDCLSMGGLVVSQSQPGTLFLRSLKDPNNSSVANCPGGIYRSSDRGVTWELMGLEGYYWVGGADEAFAVGGAEDRYLYAMASPKSTLGEGEALYVSSDGGATWSEVRTLCSTIQVNPLDGKRVYCYFERDKYPKVSLDAGITWRRFKPTETSTFQAFSLVYSGDTVLAGGDGLFISFDNEKNWQERSAGLGARRLELKINPKGIMPLYLQEGLCDPEKDRTLHRSLDGGMQWKAIAFQGCDLAFDANGRTLYRNYVRSTGDGLDWRMMKMTREMNMVPQYMQGSLSHPTQPGKLFVVSAAGDRLDVFKSLDFGDMWEKLKDPPAMGGVYPRLFYDSQGEVMYLTYGADLVNPLMYYSMDEGSTWLPCSGINSTVSDQVLAIDPRDNRHLYAATLGNGIMVSSDGCQSWKESNKGLGSLFVNAIVIDPNNPDTLYAGTDGGAYVSLDGGGTWNQINDGLLGTTVVYSIAVDKDSNVYAATPYGIFKLEGK